jgi:hypothetical protein
MFLLFFLLFTRDVSCEYDDSESESEESETARDLFIGMVVSMGSGRPDEVLASDEVLMAAFSNTLLSISELLCPGEAMLSPGEILLAATLESLLSESESDSELLLSELLLEAELLESDLLSAGLHTLRNASNSIEVTW